MSQERSQGEKYKQIYQVCKDSFDEQTWRIQSLDGKAQSNLTLLGILLGAGIFKLDFVIQTFPKHSELLSKVWIILLLSVSGLLLTSVYFSIRALQLRGFKAYPQLDDIIEKFASPTEQKHVERDVEDFYVSMADYFKTILPENERVLGAKSKSLNVAITLTKPGLLVLALFLFLSIGSYISGEAREVASMEKQMSDDKPTSQEQPSPQSDAPRPEVVPLKPVIVEKDSAKAKETH